MGYHFKSIDQLIKDINAQNEDTDSDITGGKAKLYTYVYSPKKTDTNEGQQDGYKIDSITFLSLIHI